MTQFEDSIPAALFVDYDNIASNLRSVSSRAANAFSRNVSRWLDWLESGAHARDGRPRRLLVRRCYLNPNMHNAMRSHFIKAGFQVVDCPPLTNKLKNGADIAMVMDIVDLLAEFGHVREYIILSADADFTPVLHRIRRHDRLATIFVNEITASALRNAATDSIDQDRFISEAVGVSEEEGAAPSGPPVSGGSEREVIDFIAACVRAADDPVPLARMAALVLDRFGAGVKESRWFARGSFGAMIAAADRGDLRLSTAGAGYVFDPERHGDPKGQNGAPQGATPQPAVARLDPELRDLILGLNADLDWPRLAPDQLAVLAVAGAETVRAGIVERNPLGIANRDMISDGKDEGKIDETCRVSRASFNFVLTAMFNNLTDLLHDCQDFAGFLGQMCGGLENLYETRLGPIPDEVRTLLRSRLFRLPSGPDEASGDCGAPDAETA